MNPSNSVPSSARKSAPILPTAKLSGRRRPPTRLVAGATADDKPHPRRASLTSGGPKAQRTSKTSQKLVVLPSAVQTKPLLPDTVEDLILGHEPDGVREFKSEAERMSKAQRKEAGFKRITVYCVAESFRMKLLASFLKREHNVAPRVFDEAMYVMYHLPLLPGYGPDSIIRSSAPGKPITGQYLSHFSEAEENGYQGSYFNSPAPASPRDGYISSSPVNTRNPRPPSPATSAEPPTVYESDLSPPPPLDREPPLASDQEPPSPTTDTEVAAEVEPQSPVPPQARASEENVAEVVFFDYGVVVFFGLEERQERDILEDIERAQVLKGRIAEDDWEVEEFHYTHDPLIAYPRIYNDFFTLKSRSHLLKLSISHALAQSTLLAHYETNAQRVLSSSLARSIPEQLAMSGVLQLRRHDAFKLTGRLFKLRRDVNLVSNVLDVPEVFWSEASLGELYDAVREYMEINGRVQALNEKLGVASDFLDAIHDHLNNTEMTRITWIVIWLIVVAVVVELGEIIARLIVHAAMRKETLPQVTSKVGVLRTLGRAMLRS